MNISQKNEIFLKGMTGKKSDENSSISSIESSANDDIDNNTIVVTGSHIRGINTTVGNQLITIEREKIEQQNYSTVRDLFEDIPQNFGGGATGERQVNDSAASNYSYGMSLNLRGLGPTATLALINGRRIPTAGYSANVPDISNIPISAIERIEILPDGASAVYGSDAVAGVVNFILRKDYSGLETSIRYGTATGTSYDEYKISQSGGFSWSEGNIFLSYEFNQSNRFRLTDKKFTASRDLRPYGGLDYRVPYGNPGNILVPGTFNVAFAIPPGQDGRNLTPDKLLNPQFTNYSNVNAYYDTLPRQRRHSIYGYVSQELTPNLRGFVEGIYSDRKFNNRRGVLLANLLVPPSNPYYIDIFGDGRPVTVAYSFEGVVPTNRATGTNKSLNATHGIEWEHGNNWTTTAYLSYSHDKTNNRDGPHLNNVALAEALADADPRRAFNPFGDGAVNNTTIINSILYNAIYRLKGNLYQANIISSGDAFEIMGNTIKVAGGLEYRKEEFTRRALALGSGPINRIHMVAAM